MENVIHLVDYLPKATVDATHDDYVSIQQITISRDNRISLFQHPPSRIIFPPVTLGSNPKLHLACGVKQSSWSKLKSPINFDVFVKISDSVEKHVFRWVLAPGSRPDDQQWTDQEIDLYQFSHQEVGLIFCTSVPEHGDNSYGWSAWGNPRIIHQVSWPRRRTPQTSYPHVFLISSDALRPDFLGCYGHKVMKTPHFDRLAREGSMFLHARAQTPTTLGSYMSLLSSQYPLTHGITNEWGCVPDNILSLPEYLRSYGYHSVLVPSEFELVDPVVGMSDIFVETASCLGQPAQEGSLTTRMALELLERQQSPAFFWLQYFDTHPPVTPPAPFRSMYYQGNPADEANRHQLEAVAGIRGVEVAKEFSLALPWLEQGLADISTITRLKATVDVFRGEPCGGPDLSTHLKALGPSARRGMSLADFTEWLVVQVECLEKGQVTEALVDWIKEVLPILKEVERDIISWLDGVVDFRYPLAQYMGAISYLDAQIGEIVAYLEANNLYEQSTIILTSPHGEIMHEHGISLHHHTLMESCLRIPMIIKPSTASNGGGQRHRAGARIEGIFDSIDLFPTLTDCLGLPKPPDVAGVSRYAHLIDGSPIPDHDSFVVNHAMSMVAITREPYKFLKVCGDHGTSKEWNWRKGDRILFDLRDPISDMNNCVEELPDVASELEKELEQWLLDHQSV